jgi:type II secretory ATPase GspE/PulE/Tfp pilus assembly ATPase PilB-like protein
MARPSHPFFSGSGEQGKGEESVLRRSPTSAPTPGQSAPALVDGLIQSALGRRASDIHFEPNEGGMQVRFRIHGLLEQASTIPVEEVAAVISRLKIMASLDITERRLPQDGRMKTSANGRAVDIRMSTIPSLYGEKVVLRLLDVETAGMPLDHTGLSETQRETLARLIRRPQGVIFVTGPTGSGKTSTIYACLNDIRTPTINIITIEDPIEYRLPGITQTAVNERIGLTFATCLRSVLRQDPDVILVGEIRDVETARIAMQASLTGHLVFATLHTNDAAGAITRLLDMGIPPYLIASSLSLVVGQRLVRVLCAACKVPWTPDARMRTSLGLGADPVTFYMPGECEACRGSGAVGRTGVFEVLTATPAIRSLIINQASEAELRHAAKEAGVGSMYEDGFKKVRAGTIAYEELLRVVEPDETPAAS